MTMMSKHMYSGTNQSLYFNRSLIITFFTVLPLLYCLIATHSCRVKESRFPVFANAEESILSRRHNDNNNMKRDEKLFRKTTMVGGYSEVSDLNNSEIREVVNFVYVQLYQGQSPMVSFATKLKEIPLSSSSASLKITPLEAYQQVVAGINFRVKIGFFLTKNQNNNDDIKERCIGGISAVVYRDLSGMFTVTDWGDEIKCDEVIALRQSNQIEGDQ